MTDDKSLSGTMTIGELIELLSTYDPVLRIGFKASCCPYSHNPAMIRRAIPASVTEAEDRHDVVMEVDG